jgi:exonuclease III
MCCLTSQKVRTWNGRRRFDFILATPDIVPRTIEHVPIVETNAAGSSHAPVFAPFALGV